jgi:hypothetical protein
LALLKAGLTPIVPHGSCVWGGNIHVHTHAGFASFGASLIPEDLPGDTTPAEWYAAGVALVSRCDAVLRLPGASRGADMEEAEAVRLGIPVFRDIDSVLAWSAVRG